MKNKLLLLVLMLFSFSVQSQNKQEWKDSLYIVTTLNRDVKIGKILSDDGREILLNSSEVGNIYIQKINIKSITLFNNENGTKASLFSNRYLLTTNALPSKKGDKYAIIHLFGPEINYNISDRLSLGLLTTWISSPIIGSIKYTIPTKNNKINFGLGTMIGSSGYFNAFRGFGALHYGMFTVGDNKNNLTLSAGYSYFKPGNDFRQSNHYSVPGVYPMVKSGNTYVFYTERISVILKEEFYKSPTIGLGALIKINNKCSFVFDGQLFLSTQTVTRLGQQYTIFNDSITNEPLYAVVYEQQLIKTNDKHTLAILSPGLRFNKWNKASLQVTLGGFIYKDKYYVNAVPLPSVSWLLKI